MICSRSLICSPSFFNEKLCCEMFRVCVCCYQRLLWNLNKPINPCRSRRLYFLLRCPERPCPHIFCFFYYEHQRFLSNKERAYVAAWGRQGKSASPSVFYQSAPPFFKKPLVATRHTNGGEAFSEKSILQEPIDWILSVAAGEWRAFIAGVLLACY